MREILISFIQSELFKSLLGIVMTAVLTYFVTRKTDDKKQDINIRTLQLEKIYLPLYIFMNGKKIDEIDIKVLSENMSIKKRKYFLYLSDTYLFYLDWMQNIKNSKDCKMILRKFKMYVNYEYKRLKKELGYPYKSDFKNAYVVFYLAKQLFIFMNMVIMITLSVIAIFGAELYDNYGNLVDSLAYFVAIIIMIDIIVGILYFYYKISLCEYIRIK